MLYDLHTHSNISDGILSPEDLVSSAKLAGVTHLALTDHDSVAGIDRAMVAAQDHGITIVPGLEVSTEWKGRGIHVVGLNVDHKGEGLEAFAHTQNVARQKRAREIAEKLDKCGCPDTLEPALKLANGGTVGRPHFAQAMVAKGYVSNVNAAFKRYLGSGKPGDIKQCWPGIDVAVNAIRQAGGVAVLAHPLKYKMTRTKLRELLTEFGDWGGQAVEVVSGMQTPNDTAAMIAFSEKFKLKASFGSDFHAPGQPWQALGMCRVVPDQVDPVWSLF